MGLRGPEFPADDTVYKVITVGGSTTEDLYLDDSETWSFLLMELLNSRQSEVAVWVGNGGQSGRNTVDHLVLLELLPVINEAAMLVFLIGVNDMGPSLSYYGNSTQAVFEQNAEQFRNMVLAGGGRVYPQRPFFKHSGLFRLVRRSALPTLASIAPSSVLGQLGVGPGAFLEQKRKQRAEASVVPLPSLEIGLAEYRARILRLSQECRSLDARCLFLTQPSMWRNDLNPTEEALLWGGWVGGAENSEGYVTASDLAIAMGAFNRELLDTCQQEGLECFDLAAQVPKDTSAFLDGVHFNENGARTVAQALSDYILDSEPFFSADPE